MPCVAYVLACLAYLSHGSRVRQRLESVLASPSVEPAYEQMELKKLALFLASSSVGAIGWQLPAHVHPAAPFRRTAFSSRAPSFKMRLSLDDEIRGRPLPEPLRATDGKEPGAPSEDVFTWDTITTRMPKIMDSVVATLPEALSKNSALLSGIRALQDEMKEGAQLRPLQATGPWVGAEAWNRDLAGHFAKADTWHTAPWWVVENYMYKRLLEELARAGAPSYDPFGPQKSDSLKVAAGMVDTSIEPLMDVITAAEGTPLGSEERRAAIRAALLRSLWGNQADLSLSAGQVDFANDGGEMITDHTTLAVDLIVGAAGRPVIIVLDNHGPEVVSDLVLVDAVLRLAGVEEVQLHVKDAPVFVSDVTEGDIAGILDWVEEHSTPLAKRLRDWLSSGQLRVLYHPFYTSARFFWELPPELRAAYQDAAVVVLKGDANFRRLLADAHWPYNTGFDHYAQSFWPSDGLISLRTMKSGVALGIPRQEQEKARLARPDDWLTSGVYGQVLASRQS